MTLTKNLTITLPSTSTKPFLSSTTHRPTTFYTFPAPRSPYPWVWSCHKCRTVFRFSAALNRCLLCSHRFCPKCVSEFDYSGWEHWKSYWRPRYNPNSTQKDDDEVETFEDVYKGERKRDELLWDGFEVVTREIGKKLNLYMNNNDEDEDSTPPTSPSSEGSDEFNLWEMTQSNLQRTQFPTHTIGVIPLQESQSGPPITTSGDECEPMRDWPLPPVPNGTPESGYKSVQEARKALYTSDKSGYYGTGEEGETMRDWPGCFSPGEIGKRGRGR